MTTEVSYCLKPIATVVNRRQYNAFLASNPLADADALESSMISASDQPFTIDGFCIPCGKHVSFLVDMQHGGKYQSGQWVPNWRERLECPHCRMNNRQRLVSALIKQQIMNEHGKKVYFMEQVTPIFQWAVKTFPQHTIIGSEYLGYEYDSGAVINGIRHEDIEHSSFGDQELDMIVSNDVFEHVPNPRVAFAECTRTLVRGGVMIATMPFVVDRDESLIRAKLFNGQLDHILEPVYHGNPVSKEGSLVFTSFGWEVLNTIVEAGFTQADIELYSSIQFGHLGGAQRIFKCIARS